MQGDCYGKWTTGCMLWAWQDVRIQDKEWKRITGWRVRMHADGVHVCGLEERPMAPFSVDCCPQTWFRMFSTGLRKRGHSLSFAHYLGGLKRLTFPVSWWAIRPHRVSWGWPRSLADLTLTIGHRSQDLKALSTINLWNTSRLCLHPTHSCPVCHATMAGKVQLSGEETREEDGGRKGSDCQCDGGR